MSDDRSGMHTQDRDTKHVMSVLRDARVANNHAYINTAQAIEAYAAELFEDGEIRFPYRISGDQYRSIEQGYTKDVPLWVVLIACRIYAIGPGALLGDVLGEYGY